MFKIILNLCDIIQFAVKNIFSFYDERRELFVYKKIMGKPNVKKAKILKSVKKLSFMKPTVYKAFREYLHIKKRKWSFFSRKTFSKIVFYAIISMEVRK